jgi:hypothetical protein
MQEDFVSNIASSLAVYAIRRRLAAGGTIEIPSLGITIGGTMANETIADTILSAYRDATGGVAPEPAFLRALDAAALSDAFARGQAVERERWKKESDILRAAIDDCYRRFNILYEGWRAAKSNDEVADAVSKALFDWTDRRARA